MSMKKYAKNSPDLLTTAILQRLNTKLTTFWNAAFNF